MVRRTARPVWLVLAAIALAGCSTTGSRATTTEKDGEQHVDVDLAGTAFRPGSVGARAELETVVRVHNRDIQTHTFTSGEDRIDVELSPGEDATVNLSAHPAGTFTYYFCRIHDVDGMKGKITYLTSL